MTPPQLSLLLFAIWTIAVPLGAIGWYRWSLILTRSARIDKFRSDDVQGADWYRRAMRAHANCVENLPVLGAIVLVLSLTGTRSPLLDALALAIVPARIFQSLTHIFFVETARTVSFRFSAFMVQLTCMSIMAGLALSANV